MLFFAPLAEASFLLFYFLANSGLAYQILTLLYSFISFYIDEFIADSPFLTGKEMSVFCIWFNFCFLGYLVFNFSIFFEIFLSSCIVYMIFSSFTITSVCILPTVASAFD